MMKRELLKRIVAAMLAIVLTACDLPFGATKVYAATSLSTKFGNPNNPIVYDQRDKDWGTERYDKPNGTVKHINYSGCGLLSFTNMVKYLNGEFIDPVFLANYSIHNHFRTNNGTDPRLYKSFCNDYGGKYGIRFVKVSNDFKEVAQFLQEGCVANIGGKGHRMCIVEYDKSTGKYLVLDSAPWASSKVKGIHTKYAWKTETQIKRIAESLFYIVRSTKKTKVTITAKSVTNITNTDATLNIGISPKNSVIKRVDVFMSMNKKAIDNVSLSTPKKSIGDLNHKMLWYNARGEKKSGYSFNTAKETTYNNHQIKFQSGGKTYYLKYIVMLGDGSSVITDRIQFTTGATKPSQVTGLKSVNTKGYALGEKASVTWKEAKNAEYYNIYLFDGNNKQIEKKENCKNLTWTSKAINTAGTYTIMVIAMNGAGAAKEATTTTAVKNNINVTFDYNDNNSNNQVISVKYNGTITTPKAPTRTGYSFQGWSIGNTTVSANTVINSITNNNTYTASWKPNQYLVKIVDGIDNKTIASTRVNYDSVFNARDFMEREGKSIPTHEGYTFVDYSEEEYLVNSTSTHIIYARYKWDSNDSLMTVFGDKGINRAKSKASKTANDGYSIDVVVTAPGTDNQGSGETIRGRVVVAMKTDAGRLLIETESAAFVIYPQNKAVSKTINVFVPYVSTSENNLPTVVEAYVVNDYYTSGIISNVARDTEQLAETNQLDNWEFSYNPVEKGKTVTNVNGEQKTAAEINESLNYLTYSKTTTLYQWSTDSSLAGYENFDNYWTDVTPSNHTVTYVKSFPDPGKDAMGTGFLTSYTTTDGSKVNLYNTYNKKPVTIKTDNLWKTTQTSNDVIGYIYYHWCRGLDSGDLEHTVKRTKRATGDNGEYKYYKFEAFYLAGDVLPKATYNGVTYHTAKNNSKYKNYSKDSYFWFKIPVYKQTWREEHKVFKHRQIKVEENLKGKTVPSNPANTVSSTQNTCSFNLASTGQRVELHFSTTTCISYKETARFYAFRSTEYDISHTDQNILLNDNGSPMEIKGNLGADYKDKDAIVYIYKDSQVSDYTTEYIGTTKVKDDGSVSIGGSSSPIQTRETLSEATGDFTVAVSVRGETNAVILGSIEAPKHIYKVTYQIPNETVIEDEDGNAINQYTILSQVDVVEGSTAALPDPSVVPQKDGYHFVGWSESVVNVHENLNVEPVYAVDEYAVAYVDWDNQKADIKRFEYGSVLTVPELPEVEEDSSVEWMVFTENGDSLMSLDEFMNQAGTVTRDMVLVAQYGLKKVSLSVIDRKDELTAIKKSDEVTEESLSKFSVTEEELEYGDVIQLSTLEEEYDLDDNVVFLGWKSLESGDYLKSAEINSDMTIYPVYSFDEYVDEPYADISTGSYDSEQTITLNCDTDKAVIYYTTDGTDPATSVTATQYTGPVTLTKSSEFYFVAMAAGMNNSPTVYNRYAINTESSGVPYHLVTIYSNIGEDLDGYLFQTLVKDSVRLNDSNYNDVEGYVYNGLFYDPEYTDQFINSSETVTEDVELFAYFAPNVYEVSFLDDTGALIEKMTAEYGTSVTPPQAPEKSGYRFIGWDSEDYDCIVRDSVFKAVYVPEDEYATVQLNRSSRSILQGVSITLKATITPEDLDDIELVWESDNPQVADVDDNGTVTANGIGEAMITVTIPYNKESASCKIIVTRNSDISITPARQSSLEIDSEGYLRGVKENSNSVEQLRNQFVNDVLQFSDVNGKLLTETDLVGTGSIVRLMDGNQILDELIIVLNGDINGDGRILDEDVSMISQFVLGEFEASKYQIRAMDVNGDGIVNSRDAEMLSEYIQNRDTPVALKIMKQPQDAQVSVGDTAVFTVTAAGSGLSYQWQYCNPGKATWAASSQPGSKTNTLSVTVTEKRIGQKYRCVVTDDSGDTVTSNPAAIIAKETLQIVEDPSSVTVEEGQTAVFSVRASGTNLSYQWQYKRPTASSGWANCTSATRGYNESTLYVVSTAYRSGYQYRCIVSSEDGDSVTSKAATLTMGKAPAGEFRILSDPADVKVKVGETAVFTVNAQGTGLTYQWQFLNPKGSHWSNSSSATTGYNTSKLQVAATAARNGYRYRCMVTDSKGNVLTSGDALLSVDTALTLKLVSQPESANVFVGETAVFTFSVTGTGLIYQWQYKRPASSAWGKCTSATEGYNKPNLKVVGTAVRNGYQYRCIVKDSSGNCITSEAVTLTVSGENGL